MLPTLSIEGVAIIVEPSTGKLIMYTMLSFLQMPAIFGPLIQTKNHQLLVPLHVSPRPCLKVPSFSYSVGQPCNANLAAAATGRCPYRDPIREGLLHSAWDSRPRGEPAVLLPRPCAFPSSCYPGWRRSAGCSGQRIVHEWIRGDTHVCPTHGCRTSNAMKNVEEKLA